MGMIDSPMIDALFTRSRQRVLGLLYGQPDKAFYTNEIIRISQVGSGAVQRELENLLQSGFLIKAKQGNQNTYIANKHHPLYEELRRIILKTCGLGDVLKQKLKPLQSKIAVAFIFGSVAKQEDHASSDIDILIIGTDLTYADFFELFESAENDLGRKINPTLYTPNEWHRRYSAHNHFVIKVVQGAKIFLIGNENDLGQFN